MQAARPKRAMTPLLDDAAGSRRGTYAVEAFVMRQCHGRPDGSVGLISGRDASVGKTINTRLALAGEMGRVRLYGLRTRAW